MANNKIREEEVKNRIRQEFFQDYDATPILGDIDFAVTTKKSSEGELFDQEYFLWAEAKAGNAEDIYASFVQLIITIGKAHTHESYLPPRYLGAFDEEKIAFIEYHHIVSVFYQNDFNWNVTPSNHSTKEFHMLYDLLHERIKEKSLDLLDSHVFQFDFLNDSFDRLPQSLQEIINDPEKRRKLVVYINPPYAEAADKSTVVGRGKNKTNVAVTNKTYNKYINRIGIAGREVFAQFFMRIYDEISTSVLAQFSKLKIEQAPNFRDFRQAFRAKLGRNFIVPANSFDNVKGQFPIGFFIWHLDEEAIFTQTTTDVFDAKGKCLGNKTLIAYDSFHSINDWIISTRNRDGEQNIGFMSAKGNDFQNTNYIFIINDKKQLPHPRGTWITTKNITEISIYLAVRHAVEATWINDRDQFLYPNDGWKSDIRFQNDSLIFTLFSNSNNIQSQHGTNHWIPFCEEEVGAQDNFESHFMHDFIMGKVKEEKPQQKETMQDLFAEQDSQTTDDSSFTPTEPLEFSQEAHAVLDAGRELWRYYHKQAGANPNASYYDIKMHFQGTKTTKSGKVQMNSTSKDATYNTLIANLRQAMKGLAAHIEPKIYEYGFLKK